ELVPLPARLENERTGKAELCLRPGQGNVPPFQARPLFLVCRHRQTLADEGHRLAPLPASAETQPVCRNTATSRGAGMTTTAERLAVEGGRPTRAERVALHRRRVGHL